MWKIVSELFMNASKIFPTQQRDVKRIIDVCKGTKEVDKLYVFGSSVTSACNPWSDLDLYFELNAPMQNLPHAQCEAPLDKWSNYSVDEDLKQEILSTGVLVYDRSLV